MAEKPMKIVSINCNSTSLWAGIGKTKYQYYVNEGNPDAVLIEKTNPNSPIKDDDIYQNDSPFINGFKVVKTILSNYTYIDEKTSEILPYRYDIASDFNEYGFAMVAKNGKVSWIDKNFEYLTKNDSFIPDQIGYEILCGFHQITDFSKGSIPLSRLYSALDSNVRYMGIDGQVSVFYRFDGEEIGFDRKHFARGAGFNEEGIAFDSDDNKVLFASGIFCTLDDFVKIAKKKDWLLAIENMAKNIKNENLEEKGKVLIK